MDMIHCNTCGYKVDLLLNTSHEPIVDDGGFVVDVVCNPRDDSPGALSDMSYRDEQIQRLVDIEDYNIRTAEL